MTGLPVNLDPLPSTETPTSGGNRFGIIGGQSTQGTTLSDGSVAFPGGIIVIKT